MCVEGKLRSNWLLSNLVICYYAYGGFLEDFVWTTVDWQFGVNRYGGLQAVELEGWLLFQYMEF